MCVRVSVYVRVPPRMWIARVLCCLCAPLSLFASLPPLPRFASLNPITYPLSLCSRAPPLPDPLAPAPGMVSEKTPSSMSVHPVGSNPKGMTPNPTSHSGGRLCNAPHNPSLPLAQVLTFILTYVLLSISLLSTRFPAVGSTRGPVPVSKLRGSSLRSFKQLSSSSNSSEKGDGEPVLTPEHVHTLTNALLIHSRATDREQSSAEAVPKACGANGIAQGYPARKITTMAGKALTRSGINQVRVKCS